ncbi:MAG: hypothetical protein Q7R97_00940 [Candidatus Daviesbacteria bacterium]|nr:hypothetical protein [Candidatus Daviesbacteria bacterium]
MEKKFSKIVIFYFIFGLVFACVYAWFYHWPALSLFSPGFFMVAFTWPIQIFGFVGDFMYYGFAGKSLI